MTNFIFKSTVELTCKKISQQLLVVLAEQRYQRADLNEIKFMLHKLVTTKDLQTTVDNFYDRDDMSSNAEQEAEQV